MQSRSARPVTGGCAAQATGSQTPTRSATQQRRDIDSRFRGRPPRVGGCDDVSVLALGSPLASPSDLSAVAGEGPSPMTVAGPRRIHTGFLRRHHLARVIVASGQPAPALNASTAALTWGTTAAPWRATSWPRDRARCGPTASASSTSSPITTPPTMCAAINRLSGVASYRQSAICSRSGCDENIFRRAAVCVTPGNPAKTLITNPIPPGPANAWLTVLLTRSASNSAISCSGPSVVHGEHELRRDGFGCADAAHRRAGRIELDRVVAPRVVLDVEVDADDAVGAVSLGFALHPRHGELAGLVVALRPL